MTWQRIAGFRLVSLEPQRLVRFYAALGFTAEPPAPIPAAEMAMLEIAGEGVRQRMTLGPSTVDVDCYRSGGRPYPADADAASLCFQHLALVTDDAAAAWARARDAGATPISRECPVTLPASAGGVTAIKFRDPDGHPLEFLQFSDNGGKGWPGTGILGIDHSAISVSDVEASAAFYADEGLRREDGSLNDGPTQVALDGLDEVEVRVVPLAPAGAPPHIELLGYRRPTPRRCDPVAITDVAATRIVWEAGRAGLVHDPDGHRHELVA